MKFINALLSFIFSFISVYTYSQQNLTTSPAHVPVSASIAGVLTGKITDAKTGEALPGASIYLHDLKKGTISDDKGMYRITNLNGGKYLIEITYRGYSTIIETVNVNGDTQKDFALKEAVFAGKLHFRYIDRILIEWSRNRVTNTDEAKAHTQKFRGGRGS